MKTLRLAIFLVVALAQLAVPASMIWKRQQTFREGRVWKFRTAPIDPVDAVRGRYLSLRFDAETFIRPDEFKAERPMIYATLKEDENGFATIDELSNDPRVGDDVVQVQNNGFWDGKMRVRFPFDTLWVTEADASAADAALAAHSRRGNVDAYVTVRVRSGDAAIENLYLGGETLRDYLHGTQPR
jgi:uncharacterized membrane-anchored protein